MMNLGEKFKYSKEQYFNMNLNWVWLWWQR